MKIKHTYIKEKRPSAKNAKDVYNLIKNIKDEKQEMLILLCLDTKNKVISKNIVTIGTLDSSIIHLRDVFRIAILNNANKIILAHNHPSGDTEPSIEDLDITKQIKKAGELIGIKLLDHLIIGNNYKSIINEV